MKERKRRFMLFADEQLIKIKFVEIVEIADL